MTAFGLALVAFVILWFFAMVWVERMWRDDE
jgi:hypothetical protein